MHWAFYAFMIGMPIAGWMILSAEGKPIPFYGLELPALLAKNKATAEWIEDIHTTVATAGYCIARVTCQRGAVSPLCAAR